MNKILLASAMLMAAAPTAAQGPINLPAFDSVALHGGGNVTIRHGAQQRVTLVKGERDKTRFGVDRNGQLRIDACIRACSNHDLRIEIVTPRLDGVSIEDGGNIRAEGAFPAQAILAVAINRGGSIDVLPIASAGVAAAINQGGLIRTQARSRLMASIDDGGAIAYRGQPRVTSAIHGGGNVSPLR